MFGAEGWKVKTHPRQMPVMLQRRKIYLIIKCFQLSGLNGVKIILDKTPAQQNFSYLLKSFPDISNVDIRDRRDQPASQRVSTEKNFFPLRLV